MCGSGDLHCHNCRYKAKKFGPITAEEVEREHNWWIKRIQERDRLEAHNTKIKVELDLQAERSPYVTDKYKKKIRYISQGNAVFTKKLVERMHYDTFDEGVRLTMAVIREHYWVPKLRSLVKSVQRKCNGCMRFRTTAFTRPVLGKLPQDRTATSGAAFEVIGTIRYKQTQRKEGKAFWQSLRAVYPEQCTWSFCKTWKQKQLFRASNGALHGVEDPALYIRVAEEPL